MLALQIRCQEHNCGASRPTFLHIQPRKDLRKVIKKILRLSKFKLLANPFNKITTMIEKFQHNFNAPRIIQIQQSAFNAAVIHKFFEDLFTVLHIIPVSNMKGENLDAYT